MISTFSRISTEDDAIIKPFHNRDFDDRTDLPLGRRCPFAPKHHGCAVCPPGLGSIARCVVPAGCSADKGV